VITSGARASGSLAARLQATADDITADATGDVALVAWLNYDSPRQDESAISGSAAASGAPALNQFSTSASTNAGPTPGAACGAASSLAAGRPFLRHKTQSI
jgi:hypothetical protein